MRMASSRGTGSVTVVVDTEIDSTTWVISRLIMAKPYQELVGSVNPCSRLRTRCFFAPTRESVYTEFRDRASNTSLSGINSAYNAQASDPGGRFGDCDISIWYC